MSITEQEARERERAAYVRGRMVYSTLTEEALRETARLVYPDPTTYGPVVILAGYDRRRDSDAALEAVRGLPGMAVVRAAARPEVLEWGVLDGALLSLSRYKTRDDALAECSVRNHYSHDRQDGVGARVVAIIADPGEGTV